MKFCWRMVFGLWLAGAAWTAGAVVLRQPIVSQVRQAGGVMAGDVVSTRVYKGEDGALHTEALLAVREVFKGTFSRHVKVIIRGGELDGICEADCLYSPFRKGERRLCLLRRDSRGRVTPLIGEQSAVLVAPSPLVSRTKGEGAALAQTVVDEVRLMASSGPLAGENFTDDSFEDPSPQWVTNSFPSVVSFTTNLMGDSTGISARMPAPDRGEAIPYDLDATYLPVGITREMAQAAVERALAAWSAATSLKFVFTGFKNYGMAAANLNSNDGTLHIQLHDAYGLIADGAEILGRGGLRWFTSNLGNGWTMGGNVAGSDFHKSVMGWVIIEHTSPFLSDPVNLAEVLCHEIGHALALSHSSNNSLEPIPLLAQSIMYYTAHGGQRGPVLNAYDTNVIRQLYPVANTPPFGHDRVLDVVTAFNFNTAPYNVITLRGYDLQGTVPSLQLGETSGQSGTFSTSGANLTYAPGNAYEAARLDPAGTSHYGIQYFRFTDGVNASPYYTARVISFSVDRYNEGIPDAWRLAWFGNANPAVGAKHRAGDDNDGDGLTNFQEYKLGSSPVDRGSGIALRIVPGELRFSAKPYDLYEVLSTTNLSAWPVVGTPVLALRTNAAWDVDTRMPARFFRLIKVR